MPDLQPMAAVVVASSTRTSRALDRYLRTEKEGQSKGDRFIAASGINGAIPEFAELQRKDNRKRWNKDGTRVVLKDGKRVTEGEFVQGYHVILSHAREGKGALDPTNRDHWETAHQVGVALARKVAGSNRLTTIYTQLDGASGCLHSHIHIDSIDRETGGSFDSSAIKHRNLVETTNQTLLEEGYEQVLEYRPKGTAKAREKTEKSELRKLEEHQQWDADGRGGAEPFSVAIMKQRIRELLADERFQDFDSFAEVAKEYSLDVVQRGEKGRGISYQLWTLDEDGNKTTSPAQRRRASRLGADFSMNAVEAAIQRNVQLQSQQQTAVQAQPAQSAQKASTTSWKDDLRAKLKSSMEEASDYLAAGREALLAEVRGENQKPAAEPVVEQPTVTPALLSKTEQLREQFERELDEREALILARMEAEQAAASAAMRKAWEAQDEAAEASATAVDFSKAAEPSEPQESADEARERQLADARRRRNAQPRRDFPELFADEQHLDDDRELE